MERGEIRPASGDYTLGLDPGMLGPCPGCGDAPDHRVDDQKCVENRVLAVRKARAAQEALLKMERLEALAPREEEIRRLMVD